MLLLTVAVSKHFFWGNEKNFFKIIHRWDSWLSERLNIPSCIFCFWLTVLCSHVCLLPLPRQSRAGSMSRAGSIYRKYGRCIDVSVSYRHFRYQFFRYIDIVSVTTEISVIFDSLSYFFRYFNVNLKTDNYMSKAEYLIWQCDTSLHLVTTLLVRDRS